MTLREKFKRYERRARVLEKIAGGYRQGSAEARTLKEAAYALCFALTEKHDEFTQYLAKARKPMTAADEKLIKKLGLEA